MATSSTSSQKNRYTISTVLLLLLFFLSLFIFSKRNLEPKLTIYRDLFTQSPVFTSLQQPSRSTEISINPSNPELDDNGNAAVMSDNKDVNASIEVPISSNSNLDDPNSEISTVAEAKDASYETPTSSKSDFEDKNSESADDTKETSSNVPISSKSGMDDETNGRTKTTLVDSDGQETHNEKSAASNSQSDDSSNVTTQKREPISGNEIEGSTLWQNCDFYKGTWVKDEEYPVYRPGSCPYVDDAFDCQSNGRPDSEYLKWRWKPDGCDLPRFNATDFLVRLRGKRLMLVGDSMNRNQFESLLCLLREGLQNKSKMYEVHGYKITKGRGQYIFNFEDYNCTVEFVRSHFLVREGIRLNAQGNSNPTLSIDRIDKSANRWKRANILVFNTGHWWTHGKTARGKNYYKEGDYIYPHFDAVEAYTRALKTWGKWVDKNTSPEKLVFYRGYSSAHFRGGEWDSGGTCIGEKEPVLTGGILDNYPLKMKIVEEVIQGMQVPVVLLNVTRLTNFRKDGHPSIYGKNVTAGIKVSTKRQDCSHWCLPGVPDAWNELIYATLVVRQTSSSDN